MDSTLISDRPNEETPSLNRARRAALGSFAGAVVDWYDFLLYGITAALVFNREFFPQVSPAMGTLAAFATFGVGFLFRPLGGVIFGHFGDRLGRKRMLMLTVWMMGIATALIGILPSFASIGWWAPVLLVTLRAIQGFAVGGEWGGAALLSVESAPKHRKAFYSSGVQVGYGVGLLLSTGLVSLISQLTTDEQFLSWGWRIPFIFSIVLVIAALWIRNGMEESAEFEKQQLEKPLAKKRLPVMEALVQHPGAVYRHRVCPELLDAESRSAARAVPEYRPAGRRDQLPDNPLLRVAGGQVWPPSRLHHRGADWHPQRLAILYGAGGAVDLLDCLLRHHARQHRSRHGGVRAAADVHRAVWRKLPLQRRGSGLPGGKRGRRRIYAVYCRRAGDLLRRQLAQRGDLSARRLPAVGGNGAADERDEPPLISLLFHRRVTYYRVESHTCGTRRQR